MTKAPKQPPDACATDHPRVQHVNRILDEKEPGISQMRVPVSPIGVPHLRHAKPVRYVMAVVEDGERLRWRVVVSTNDAAQVLTLANVGKIITVDDVHSWVRLHARFWPKEFQIDEFSDFLTALNVLRVTRSRTVSDLQNETPERRNSAERMRRVKNAIETLAGELPDVVGAAQFGRYPRYPPELILRLQILAKASSDALGIIEAPTPPAREATWHETAQLMEWHLRNLLDLAGAARQGSHADGPMVAVIMRALVATEGHHTTGHAISKALERAASEKKWIYPVERFEAKGFIVVA